MNEFGIMEAFDEIDDSGIRLVVGGKVLAVNQLPFEGAPEAFFCGVILIIAPAAQGDNKAGPVQGVGLISDGVLNAVIGVAKQFGRFVNDPQIVVYVNNGKYRAHKF